MTLKLKENAHGRQTSIYTLCSYFFKHSAHCVFSQDKYSYIYIDASLSYNEVCTDVIKNRSTHSFQQKVMLNKSLL